MKKLFIGIVAATMLIALPAASAAGEQDWTLQVVSPQPNDVITAPYLSIHVNPHGFRFDIRYAGTPNLPDVGHYDKIIDGRLIDMSGSHEDTISMVGITQGSHILTLVPALNNNTEISSAAIDIPFTYAGPFLPQPGPYSFPSPPALMITSPPNGSSVQGGSFDLTVDIQNFVLSGDSFGREMVDGVGHWEIFVDVPMMKNCTCNMSDPAHVAHMAMMMTHLKGYTSSTTQPVSLKGLEPKQYHTFTIMLVDNQHMMLMPMVMSSITLYVVS